MKLVLVVDDELIIRQVIEDVLRDEGYDVLVANGGRRMLEVLESARPDLILLDVMMPNGDGREAFRIMQSQPHLRHIPVVVISAGVTTEQWGEEEVAAFLAKPFDLDELLNTISRFTRSHPG